MIEPRFLFSAAISSQAPSDQQCFAWCDRFEMLPHIRQHSELVAMVATALAIRAKELKLPISVQAVRASALLHDLAKTYTIEHGGNHCQVGGAWVQELTNDPAIAQGVVHHVYWPGEIDPHRYFLPLVVMYSDKLVKHDAVVSLEERYADLFIRYGTTPARLQRIKQSLSQVKSVETQIGNLLGVNLNACSFDCGRLVE